MTSFARKRTLVITLVTIGASSFIAALVLFEYWFVHSPANPRSETGEIYAMNQHGYYFYVTRGQKTLHDALLYAFALFGFGGAILDTRWKTIPNPHDDTPKKFY